MRQTMNALNTAVYVGSLRQQILLEGFIPVVISDRKITEVLSRKAMRESISHLEDILQRDDGVIAVPMPGAWEWLHTDPDRVIYFIVDRSGVYNIIDSVRNIILRWSLQLEKDGLAGEGLKFSPQEKEVASTHVYNIENYINVNAMTNSQIQQGTSHSKQQPKIKIDHLNATKDFIREP